MKPTKIRTQVFRVVVIILICHFYDYIYQQQVWLLWYKKHEQVVLTEEQIKQFEQDVKDGKNIDLQNYLENTNKDYQTKFSQLGLNVSNSLANIVKNSVDGFFKYVSKFVVE